ncbi:hypothetical protein STEG23_014305 [Scotinomys teguina]
MGTPEQLLNLLAFFKLKNNSVGDDRWLELLFFLKEFCEFTKNLNAPKKDALFKTMINLGIISALKVSVYIEDYELKLVAVEIFTYLVEYNTWIVQVYAIEEALDSENVDDFLINIMIKQITCDSDPESSQLLSLAAVLHTLLDPENMGVTANGCERMEFMNFFYTHCINNLAGPVLSIIGQNNNDDNRDNICPDNYQNAQLPGVVLELLSFCVNHHTTYIKEQQLAQQSSGADKFKAHFSGFLCSLVYETDEWH